MINTFNEKSLHAALKALYVGADGQAEVPVDGYVVDVVHDDLLIEIQTASFSSIKQKLLALTATHRVLLVYPVALEKWIVRLPGNGSPVKARTRRKSPRRGSVLDLYTELVSFPALVAHPNFGLDVVLTREDELRTYDRRRGWRRKGWVIADRELVDVVDRCRYTDVADFGSHIPDDLAEPFTTLDLARATGRSRRLCQRMAYCWREMGLAEAVGRRRRSVLYRRTSL